MTRGRVTTAPVAAWQDRSHGVPSPFMRPRSPQSSSLSRRPRPVPVRDASEDRKQPTPHRRTGSPSRRVSPLRSAPVPSSPGPHDTSGEIPDRARPAQHRREMSPRVSEGRRHGSSSAPVPGNVFIEREGSNSPRRKRRDDDKLKCSEPRSAICARLCETRFLEGTHPMFMHGRAYYGPLRPPRPVKKLETRKDSLDEFEECSQVSLAKCRQLANLLRLSRKTTVYAGPGISSAVIAQAPVGNDQKPDRTLATPSLTHQALGLLLRHNLIHSWIQLAVDGLPQKAGIPQECINELNGSLFDPSNPPVRPGGECHSRALSWLERDAADSDLVLVLGTALGSNSDHVVTKAAERSLMPSSDRSLGVVSINRHPTVHDGKMTLRFFEKPDKILSLLLKELDLEVPRSDVPAWTIKSKILVPYDKNGRRLPESSGKRMWLDLSDHQKIRSTPGSNTQSKPHAPSGGRRECGGRTQSTGLGVVVKRDHSSASFVLIIDGVQMRLGIWWLESAMHGLVDVLPVVNQVPLFVEVFEGS